MLCERVRECVRACVFQPSIKHTGEQLPVIYYQVNFYTFQKRRNVTGLLLWQNWSLHYNYLIK